MSSKLVMRVLAVTKIFPNRLEPLSAPFNRQQFGALARHCQVEVLASIPWYPGARLFARWSNAGRLHDVPKHDLIDGLSVHHPRFLFLPRVGHAISGPLYAASLASQVLAYRGCVDVVLGAWAYPDGFAAVVLAELLGVPAVVKLHGSDMNVVAELPGPRRRLRWALPRAARVVAVSQPLARAARSFGVDADRIDVVPNGVDTACFRAGDRGEARSRLGLDRDAPLVLYVGRMEQAKGVLDLMRAFRRLRARSEDVTLALVGEGSAFEECRRLAEPIAGAVRFAGARPHAEVADWLAACDLLALPSWNEGMPNAVVEAVACGRPVVATRVGAIPDIVHCPLLGELVEPRQPQELAAALERVLARPRDAEAIARAARVIDWDESARRLAESLASAVAPAKLRAA